MIQSMRIFIHNNADSKLNENNLLPEEQKFSIHTEEWRYYMVKDQLEGFT